LPLTAVFAIERREGAILIKPQTRAGDSLDLCQWPLPPTRDPHAGLQGV